MIHQKEWITCDRCGAEIKKTPRGAGNIHRLRRIFCKPEELLEKLEAITADRYGYVSNTELISPKIASIEIVEYYSEKQKRIQLCEKCRKDFGEFMKNERE